MRTDRLRLLDAIEQITLIREFSQMGRDSFFGDVLRQKAILHCLALLGEACRGISPEFREAHSNVPWNQIIAFRNVIIHEYFGIDLDLIWTIVTEHVGALESSLASILESCPD